MDTAKVNGWLTPSLIPPIRKTRGQDESTYAQHGGGPGGRVPECGQGRYPAHGMSPHRRRQGVLRLCEGSLRDADRPHPGIYRVSSLLRRETGPVPAAVRRPRRRRRGSVPGRYSLGGAARPPYPGSDRPCGRAGSRLLPRGLAEQHRQRPGQGGAGLHGFRCPLLPPGSAGKIRRAAARQLGGADPHRHPHPGRGAGRRPAQLLGPGVPGQILRGADLQRPGVGGLPWRRRLRGR